MDVPDTFHPVDHHDWLVDKVSRLGYSRSARFVAFWWEECDNQLAWADSDLKIALGLGDNYFWLSEVRPILFEFSLGSPGVKAKQVLVWDRQQHTLWIAPRYDGIMFLSSVALFRRQGNGRSR